MNSTTKIASFAASTRTAWNRFFFEPQGPSTLAVFRIAFGIVVLLSLLGKFPAREIFYGADGIVSLESMDRYFSGNSLFWFRWVPDADPALKIYFLGMIAATTSLILGFQTRVSAVLVFLGLASLTNRNLYIDNHGDNLLRINAFWLMFADAGAAYSMDAWLRAKKGLAAARDVSPWPLRMIQIQLCILYFETAYTKDGAAWMDGTALYYALNYLELRRFDFTFLFTQLWAIKIATYGTLAAEYAAATLIWFRRLRYPVLAMAACLHLGINLAMQFPVFQYAMLATLIAFIPPADMQAGLTRLGRGPT